MIFFDVTILKFIILLAFKKQIFELRIIEKFINNIVKKFYVSNEVKMIYRMLFQYVVYKKGIKNRESSTAFVNFYQHILSDLDHYFDVFQKFIEIFYDMKYGEEICFFTIFFIPKLEEFIESVTFNYKMKLNYLIETNVCIRKLYNRKRQQTTIKGKLEPVTNIFNNINKIKNIFKEAITWLYDAKLIAVDIEFLPDIVGG
uniref:Uncharacterized protein n=1 Tax=Strongyloides stercoralis TaxID=6248 RepID=A0AAF5DQF0_STRER